MIGLTVKVTDLQGVELGLITQFTNLEVEIPLNDSRTGRLQISMSDRNAVHILPIKRLIKVYWGDELVVWGHIVRPRFRFSTGMIEVDIHDPTLKLKHHFHRFGDIVVDEGYPLDGRGIYWLLESAIPIQPQLDRGIPGNGIEWGADSTIHQGPKPTQKPPEPGSGIWGRCIRGENVWDSIQKAVMKSIGPDIEFVPVEGLDPGFFVQLNVGAKPDDPGGGIALAQDKSESVKFMYPINCEDFIWEPDGNAMRNYWVAVNPGGEEDAHDDDNKSLYHDEDSWLEYGIFGTMESVGEVVEKEVLAATAEAWVTMYAVPPDFFTVIPKRDALNVPKYPIDFDVGDFVTVKGDHPSGISKTHVVRVTKVTLKQEADGTRQGRMEIECTPALEGAPAAGGEDDN